MYINVFAHFQMFPSKAHMEEEPKQVFGGFFSQDS